MKQIMIITFMLIGIIGLSGCATSGSLVKSSSDNSDQNTEASIIGSFADGNVWTTMDGTKNYKCPVMGGEGRLDEAPAYSDVKGARIYHCCPPCQGPFRSNPGKYLSELSLPGNIVTVLDNGEKVFRDPVTGAESHVHNDTRYVDYNAKRYFFADQKTLKQFENAPERYILEE